MRLPAYFKVAVTINPWYNEYMIQTHVVFTDTATTVRWDTNVPYTSEDKDEPEALPPEGSEPYHAVVQKAVENIWGNMYSWRNSGRYDLGHVTKKNTYGIEKITNLLKVVVS